jgi:sialate O-acetylesterase
MKNALKTTLLFLLLLSPVAHAAESVLRVPGVFTDHMVLQREMPVPVWGWAKPGEEVTVEFAGQKKTAKADANGKWMVKLDSMPASAESRDLAIASPSGSLHLGDVLVGDVWLCTGQSNMGFGVRGSLNPEQEIANAQYPSIRLFIVKPNPVLEPAADLKGALKSGGWEVCSPQNVGDFSGVGYFFGREIHGDLKIPIGLLRTSLGGTEAEAWTTMEAQRTLPAVIGRSEVNFALGKSQEEDNRKFITDRAAWEEKNGVKPPPVSDAARGWADPALSTADWTTVTQSASWSQLKTKSGGVFWARKEITLPQDAAGKPFNLGLGNFDEQYDTAYLNGVELSRLVPDKAPDFYLCKRFYKVPGNLVKAGRNVIAVRVVSATDRAAMWQLVHPLELPPWMRASSDGPWVIKKELSFPPLSPEALASRPKPNNLWAASIPSGLFNGMIAPLMPFAVKGAIWYQGESNGPRPTQYRDLLSTMIGDWRKRWGQGDFPFLIMQLVNNGDPATDPNHDPRWPLLREAQQQVAASVPNSGMAVGIEIGSATTIHPPNKQDAGKRLALVALEKVYGKTVESSGPRYESMKTEGSAIRLSFTHAQGLTAKDAPPKNFAIAGADRNFVWAEAELDAATSTIVVSSPKVPQPIAVRYAWAANPEGCNLFNGVGLPMAPFRTDDWPVEVEPAKRPPVPAPAKPSGK